MNRTTVLATGLGVVSSIGCSTDTFWQCCANGITGIAPLPWAKEFGCRAQVCGQVKDEELRRALGPLAAKTAALGRHHQLALAAAVQAVQDASTIPEALVVGTATGGFEVAEQSYSGMEVPFRKEMLYFDDLATTVAQLLRLDGPRVTISTGCTSSVDAIGHALWMIRDGRWKSALVVAAEAALTPSTLAAFDVLGAVTNAFNDEPAKASRPFSKDRSGFVLAEGAGAVLLEHPSLAEPRRAKVYGGVSGFGSVNSAYHMTSIETDGRAIARSIIAALEDTQAATEIRGRIAYINAHGSGTNQNDQAEAAAFRTVFGARARAIPVNSTKAMAGHSLGAAGLVETVHLLLSMSKRTVTPAVNADVPDPEIDLLLPKEPLNPHPIPYALKTASGFSGIHSALIFEAVQ